METKQLREQYNQLLEQIFELQETIDYLETINVYGLKKRVTELTDQKRIIQAQAINIDSKIYFESRYIFLKNNIYSEFINNTIEAA